MLKLGAALYACAATINERRRTEGTRRASGVQLNKTRILLAAASPDQGPAGRQVTATQRTARRAAAAQRAAAVQSREGPQSGPVLCRQAIEQNNTPFCSKMDAEQGLACHLFLLSPSREQRRRQPSAPQRRNPREADVSSCASPRRGDGRGERNPPQRKKRTPDRSRASRDASASPCTFRIARLFDFVKPQNAAARRVKDAARRAATAPPREAARARPRRGRSRAAGGPRGGAARGAARQSARPHGGAGQGRQRQAAAPRSRRPSKGHGPRNRAAAGPQHGGAARRRTGGGPTRAPGEHGGPTGRSRARGGSADGPARAKPRGPTGPPQRRHRRQGRRQRKEAREGRHVRSTPLKARSAARIARERATAGRRGPTAPRRRGASCAP